MAPVPVIVVGAGSIGQRHIEVAQASDVVELVAVVEPVAEQRDRLAQAGLPMVATLEDVPRKARGAIIATPTPDHVDSAAACLDLGHAVLIEKPIAHTLGAAQNLMEKARGLDLPLYVGHHRRCHPFSIAAREGLEQLGTLVGVQGLWSLRKHDSYYDAPWRTLPGAGPLMTNLSHEVDLLQFLMGDISCVTATASHETRGLGVEDTAALTFEFVGGALGSFLMSDAGLSPWAFEAGCGENPAVAPSDEDYLRFVGTNGAMAFPSLTMWRADEPPADWTTRLSKEAGKTMSRVDPLAEQLDRFAAVIDGKEDTVLCTAEAGMRALAVTLAASFAAREGRAIRPNDVPLDFNGS